MCRLYANTFHINYLYIMHSRHQRFWYYVGPRTSKSSRTLRDDCMCVPGCTCVQSHVTKGNVCMFSLAEEKPWPLGAVVNIAKAWWLHRLASNSGELNQFCFLPSHLLTPCGDDDFLADMFSEGTSSSSEWGRSSSWILALAANFVFQV